MTGREHSLVDFLFGCCGGLTINVARLGAVSFFKREAPTFDGVYWAQFVGFSLLGGLLALANDLTSPLSPLAAWEIGATIPASAKALLSEFASPPTKIE